MVLFSYNGKEYSSEDWAEGFVRLPSGQYLEAVWENGKPIEIKQKKLVVAPPKYSVAKLR